MQIAFLNNPHSYFPTVIYTAPASISWPCFPVTCPMPNLSIATDSLMLLFTERWLVCFDSRIDGRKHEGVEGGKRILNLCGLHSVMRFRGDRRLSSMYVGLVCYAVEMANPGSDARNHVVAGRRRASWLLPRPPQTKDCPILSRATTTQHCVIHIIHMDVNNTRQTPPLAPPATTITDVTPSKVAGTSAHSEFREGSGYAHTSPMSVLDPCSPTLHVRT